MAYYNFEEHVDMVRASRIALTPLQRQVMELVLAGLIQEEIGRRLGRSRRSVAGVVKRVCIKVGASNMQQAVAILVKLGEIGQKKR